MTAKPEVEANPVRTAKAQTYVPGSHSARIRTEHDERRTELLARDEVLAAEISIRETERHDISEALRLTSEPAPVQQGANVVSPAAFAA